MPSRTRSRSGRGGHDADDRVQRLALQRARHRRPGPPPSAAGGRDRRSSGLGSVAIALSCLATILPPPSARGRAAAPPRQGAVLIAVDGRDPARVGVDAARSSARGRCRCAPGTRERHGPERVPVEALAHEPDLRALGVKSASGRAVATACCWLISGSATAGSCAPRRASPRTARRAQATPPRGDRSSRAGARTRRPLPAADGTGAVKRSSGGIRSRGSVNEHDDQHDDDADDRQDRSSRARTSCCASAAAGTRSAARRRPLRCLAPRSAGSMCTPACAGVRRGASAGGSRT